MGGRRRRLVRRRAACRSQSRGARRRGHRRRRGGKRLSQELSHHERRSVGDARFAAPAVSPHPPVVAGRARRDADRRSHQPCHQRHSNDPGLRRHGAAGYPDERPRAGRHRRRDAVPELALHAHLALDRAAALSGGLRLHETDQDSLAQRAKEGRRAALDGPGGLFVDPGGKGLRPRGATRSAGSSGRVSTTWRRPWRRGTSR